MGPTGLSEEEAVTKKDCELSSRRVIRAFYGREHLVAAAEGDLPSPGFDVDIERSPLTVEPPQFSLVRCRKPGVFPQVITPFRYCEVFRIGIRRDTVIVHHADGADEVVVEDLEDNLADGIGRFLPNGAIGPANEAIGRSARLSFDEAFADALDNLPPASPSHPDQLEQVQVVEIGALFGGIAGFRHLFVKVRRELG